MAEGFDSRDENAVVIYKSLQDGRIWTRPKIEFLSEVAVGEEKKPRFVFLRENENGSWEERYKRALADYQNLLKQTAKEKAEFAKYALTDFLHNILPIYDYLKMSLVGLDGKDKDNPWVEGVEHVLHKFKKVLNQHGIEEIRAVGEKFNYDTMEAVGGQGERVKQEVMPGYKLHDKVIRHAKVILG